MPGTLYVVGTPIGNLGDFSQRGIETLQTVDFIAAEDTRVTQKLLNRFGIKKPALSYHAHSFKTRGEEIINRLQSGENGAIVTDAGMPCISDPGEELVRLCYQNGLKVEVIPGPSALISALAISGLKVSRFSFEGFLSVNKTSRKKHLEEIKASPYTMVFYEAPHKLYKTLRDLYTVLGERSICLARELTKIYEETLRMKLSEALELYRQKEAVGEFVLIIEGKAAEKKLGITLEEAAALVLELEESRGLSEAAKEAARQSGFSKSEIYKAALQSKQSV
ncbi:MAG: 16S rRNA (cytidine(1402)-2'-O)-methyltransferase [Oscillospiraceae bacterium]|jgi:16S rRNA (cytidine1402-2'-O)-methyltransferase|nr:16S rRNA (cytidine(1402)-2'-O)-methyltransferase [Oscillospiraceae bacterium]